VDAHNFPSDNMPLLVDVRVFAAVVAPVHASTVGRAAAQPGHAHGGAFCVDCVCVRRPSLASWSATMRRCGCCLCPLRLTVA
jgi:hypothetical protein